MLKYYSDKKVQAIRNYLNKVPQRPILILTGTTGIGKYTAVCNILKEMGFDKLYVGQYIKNEYLGKEQNSLLYALTEQLSGVNERQAIVLRDLEDPNERQQLNRLLSKYHSAVVRRPLILVLNSSVVRDFKIKKVFGTEFLNQFCQVEQFIGPTKHKMEQFLKELPYRYASDIAELSNGDMGCAKNMALLHHLGGGTSKTNKDTQITIFNTLGRILYNKRKDKFGQIRQLTYQEMVAKPSPEYYFDPFQIVNSLQISQQAYRNFLQVNSYKFFPDVSDLSKLLDLFADLDVFEKFNYWNEKDNNQRESNDCLNSQIITLGVMQYNLHISDKPKQMTSMQAPFHYELARNITMFKNGAYKSGIHKQHYTTMSVIYKIVRRRYPGWARMGQAYLDESELSEDWFSQEPLLNQAPHVIPNKPTTIRVLKNQCNLIPKKDHAKYMADIESMLD